MNKKGEFLSWLVIIVVAVVAISIFASVIGSVTTPIDTLHYNTTSVTRNASEDYEAIVYEPFTLNNTPVLDVLSVENLRFLDEGTEWNHTGNVVTLINESYNESTLTIVYTYNYSVTSNYTVTTYPEGYVSSGVARIILPFIVIIFALGICVLAYGLVVKQ
jgi:hypothetical protein